MRERVEHQTGTSCHSLGTAGLLLVLPKHQHLWMGMEALPLQEEPLGTELSTGPGGNFFSIWEQVRAGSPRKPSIGFRVELADPELGRVQYSSPWLQSCPFSTSLHRSNLPSLLVLSWGQGPCPGSEEEGVWRRAGKDEEREEKRDRGR